MVEINTDDNKLEFELDIKGTGTTPNVRLIMPMSSSYSIMVEGELSEDREHIFFNLPNLRKLFESDMIRGAKLEVLVDGELFYPWEGDLHLVEPKKVEAKVVECKISPKKSTLVSVKPFYQKSNNIEDVFDEVFEIPIQPVARPKMDNRTSKIMDLVEKVSQGIELDD